MIAFTLNGAPHQIDTPVSLACLLEELGYGGKRIAIELNGEIVPKSRHAATPVTAGSRVEIVIAVGGG